MDTVVNRGDGRLVLRHAWPDPLPHAARDLAVQLAHPVGAGCQAQGEDSHTEGRSTVRRILAPQSQELLPRETKSFVVIGEVLVHEMGWKPINPSRHGGVSGENVAGRGGLPGLGEREPLFCHKNADSLQSQERGMPLVQVADGRADAQGFQSADAADSQHDFLLDTHLQISAI